MFFVIYGSKYLRCDGKPLLSSIQPRVKYELYVNTFISVIFSSNTCVSVRISMNCGRQASYDCKIQKSEIDEFFGNYIYHQREICNSIKEDNKYYGLCIRLAELKEHISEAYNYALRCTYSIVTNNHLRIPCETQLNGNIMSIIDVYNPSETLEVIIDDNAVDVYNKDGAGSCLLSVAIQMLNHISNYRPMLTKSARK